VFPDAKNIGAADLRIGLTAEFEREITEADVFAFASNSGDANPLHVDAEYGRSSAYGGRLVHGAFQVGLASALIGMYLPGRHTLLANISARFPSPLLFPCRVRVRGEVTAWQAETRGGQLRVTVIETSKQVPTAEIMLGFTLHGLANAVSDTARPASAAAVARGSRVVLITGASGGVGSELVELLANEYDVLAMTHRTPLSDRLRTLPHVQEWHCDLSHAQQSRDGLTLALAGRPLYGVVHAAWPGAPAGGLLQGQDDVVESQIVFGATTTVRLARLLFETVGSEGGRFIAVSSVVGSHKPVIALSAYSLGKATLEAVVKLLAPELARRNVTINAISPGFIPVGMNKHKNEQQRKIEASRIPLGRLCEPSDLASMVGYLLSPGAGFVSGQVIGLSGGQL